MQIQMQQKRGEGLGEGLTPEFAEWRSRRPLISRFTGGGGESGGAGASASFDEQSSQPEATAPEPEPEPPTPPPADPDAPQAA